MHAHPQRELREEPAAEAPSRPPAAGIAAVAGPAAVLALQRCAGNHVTVTAITAAAAGAGPAARGKRALARTKAEVIGAAGKVLGEHSQGKGGRGGATHCEQKSWGQARGAVEKQFKSPGNDEIAVRFKVDQTICPGCQDWFDGPLFMQFTGWAAQNPRNGQPRAFRVIVEVNRAQVEIRGAGETAWTPAVGDQERLSPAQQLRPLVEAMGRTFEIIEHGKPREMTFDPDDEATMLRYKDEIEAAYDEWFDFAEAGGSRQSSKKAKGADVKDILDEGGGKTAIAYGTYGSPEDRKAEHAW